MHRGAIAIGLFFAFFGAVFVVVGWGSYFKDRWIIDHGTMAPATITKKTRTFVADGDSDFYLHYRFMRDGAPVEGLQGVPQHRWSHSQVGEPLTIRYHPQSPTRTFIDNNGNGSLGMTLFITGFGAVFFVLGMAITIGGVRHRQKNDTDVLPPEAD